MTQASGPLKGVRVVEFTGLGPAPFAAMLLSDLGADVLRIDRPGGGAGPAEVTARGRASLALNLKAEADRATALRAMAAADVVIEGFRPGVMERLGLGPGSALKANPRLVYGRMTGWGQEGPLAQRAGHDINYIAVAGVLGLLGADPDGPPVLPLNLAGDFGGGALYLAFGIVAALFEAQRSGRGQVVDAAIVDGAASQLALFAWMRAAGISPVERGRNLLSGAQANYRVYECADGKHVAVGALEPAFFQTLIGAVAEAVPGFSLGGDPTAALAAAFRMRTRDDWAARLEGLDACAYPVLDLDEAAAHPHTASRGTWTKAFGVVQPAPAPRFSATPGAIQGPPPAAGEGGEAVLKRWGVADG